MSIQSIGARPSAAHLKFLNRKPQTPFRNFKLRNFKWIGGTGISKFAIAHDFPKFVNGAR